MDFRKVIASLTFRYIAKYLLVLTGTVFLLVAGIYSIFSYNYFRELGASIVEEEETLQIIYTSQGVSGIDQYLKDQRQTLTRPFSISSSPVAVPVWSEAHMICPP